MVHHGRKIDGRGHVLSKSNVPLKILKARKGNLLCLSSIIACVALSIMVVPSIVMAQQDPVYLGNSAGQTEIRIQQLETQIRQLTGKVEEQVYEVNSLKQKIRFLEKSSVPSQSGSAPQQQSGASNTGQFDASQIAPPSSINPLGVDFSAQQPRGIQSRTVTGSTTDATAQYEQAYANLKSENYEQAQKGFDGFLSTHSDHVLAANAKYWLGETYYVRGDYKKSARVFAEGFQTYPDSVKAPDILLKLGLSLKGLGKEQDACVALGQVPVKFPSGNGEILKRAEQERNALSCDA